jgi:hypothetical protein
MNENQLQEQFHNRVIVVGHLIIAAIFIGSYLFGVR